MIQAKTWVEVDPRKLNHNVSEFRKRVGERVKIAGVLKSNAYGHGLELVAKNIKDSVDFFAVDSVDEALQLKKVGVSKDVLILGYTLKNNLEEVVKNGLHQVVANYETLELLNKIGEKNSKLAKVHLKIETGTSRQGILLSELPKFLDFILNCKAVVLAGVSTHFANIEDTTDHSYALFQLSQYQKALEMIEQRGFKNYIRHTACSAAAVLFQETHFDMVRLGISLYGMWSSTETQVSAKQEGIDINLKPALTWKTKVAHIKTLPAGTCVSYGCTEKLTQETKTAILPIGYWDGFDRELSSIGNVLIKGVRCRVLGRVCMNMVVVDVNQLSEVRLEDEVVLLGSQGDEFVSAEEIARKTGTINYEVTTRINPLIKRIIDEHK